VGGAFLHRPQGSREGFMVTTRGRRLLASSSGFNGRVHGHHAWAAPPCIVLRVQGKGSSFRLVIAGAAPPGLGPARPGAWEGPTAALNPFLFRFGDSLAASMAPSGGKYISIAAYRSGGHTLHRKVRSSSHKAKEVTRRRSGLVRCEER